MPALRLQRRDGQEGLFLREQHLPLCTLDAKRIRLSKSQAAKLLRDGRIHVNEVYSAKRDAYYPADLILKDDGERVIYWLDFGRKEKSNA